MSGASTEPPPLRAVVALADPVLRVSTCTALSLRGFIVVAEPDDAPSLVAAASRERPDLCLIDVNLAGNAQAAVSQVAARAPATTIVALAAVASTTQMIAVLERGASGYLTSDIGAPELAKTLRAACAGEPALPRSLVPHLIEHIRNNSGRLARVFARDSRFTARERDVAEHLVAGRTTAEIAVLLGVSAVTVRRHASSLMSKCAVSTRSELVELLSRVGH
jgi:two-component system nitrate/nitrite response regulator NarL